MLIKGSNLTTRQREQVCAAFVHRHTRENAQQRRVPCVLCADGGPADREIVIPAGQRAAAEVRTTWHRHHVSVQTDAEWLAEHAFHFTKDGRRLMASRRHAEPAWLADRAVQL